jgi:hypothetical protein
MRPCTQLAQEQQYKYAMIKVEHSQAEIVTITDVRKSTDSRDVRRNCGLKGYRLKQARQLRINRHHAKAKHRSPLSIGAGLTAYCAWTGTQDKSVSGWCRIGMRTTPVSTPGCNIENKNPPPEK